LRVDTNYRGSEYTVGFTDNYLVIEGYEQGQDRKISWFEFDPMVFEYYVHENQEADRCGARIQLRGKVQDETEEPILTPVDLDQFWSFWQELLLAHCDS
jgi:hypothetical protein